MARPQQDGRRAVEDRIWMKAKRGRRLLRPAFCPGPTHLNLLMGEDASAFNRALVSTLTLG